MRQNPLDAYLQTPPSDLSEAAEVYKAAWDEIQHLRKEHGEIVSNWLDAMNRPQLTNAEREAVASCIADDEAATAYDRAATLRGLLERTK